MNEPYQTESCFLRVKGSPQITLEHGSGGQRSHALIHDLFYKYLSNEYLQQDHDGATLPPPLKRIVISTDSYVVNPMFFPGGDIGKLAVIGTTNDLAMCGAVPKYLSLSLIMEEGLAMNKLETVLESISETAKNLQVQIVTGDTKVVEKGHGDGLYINTTGIGILNHDLIIGPQFVRKGDCILINGDIGRHALAILNARSEFSFDADIASDMQSLVKPVIALINEGVDIHCLRDLTRGGLASGINEIALACHYEIELEEAAIPVDESVRDMCEILGLEPYQLANEGCFVCVVPESHAARSLEILRSFRSCAQIIGRISHNNQGRVCLSNPYGCKRMLPMPLGVTLPRIC